MLAFIVKRVLLVVPVALGVTLFCFLLVRLAPGDPLIGVLPADATAAQAEELRVEYGFDRPLHVQYGLWLARVARGDLGSSIATGRSVNSEVFRAVANTFAVAVLASLIGFAAGWALGLTAGYWKNTWIDSSASTAAILGVSIPHFWLGMVLTILFSVWLGWLPATGDRSDLSIFSPDRLKYMLLPALTMSVVPMGVVARTIRAIIAEVLSQDFVSALHARGLRNQTVFLHVIKNALPATITVVGLQFGYLVGGSILIETVFAWPGAGLLLNTAIFQRDLPLLQGTILVLSLLFVLTNLLVDVVQGLIDPRINRTA